MARPKPFARTTLRPRHRPVVRALAEAFFSTDDELDSGRLESFVDEVDRFISPASKTLRFGLCVMIDVVRWAPLFVIGRFSTFESLPSNERARMLHAMDHSKLAELALILVAYKMLLTILFFESDAELRAIGYPGPERHRYNRMLSVTARNPHPPALPTARRDEASP